MLNVIHAQSYLPQGYTVILWSRSDGDTLEQMGVDNVLEDLHMEIPLLLFGPMSPIRCLEKVPSNVVVLESFGQSLSRLLVLMQVQKTHTFIR